eukprot:COSAG06_NODE_6956_length_2699_cov_4.983202_2_plen_253_part_00
MRHTAAAKPRRSPPAHQTQRRGQAASRESRHSRGSSSSSSSNRARTAPLASTNTVWATNVEPPAATCTTLVGELSCAGVLRSVVSPRPSRPSPLLPVAHACNHKHKTQDIHLVSGAAREGASGILSAVWRRVVDLWQRLQAREGIPPRREGGADGIDRAGADAGRGEVLLVVTRAATARRCRDKHVRCRWHPQRVRSSGRRRRAPGPRGRTGRCKAPRRRRRSRAAPARRALLLGSRAGFTALRAVSPISQS